MSAKGFLIKILLNIYNVQQTDTISCFLFTFITHKLWENLVGVFTVSQYIFKVLFKVGLSTSKKKIMICFNDSPSKMMKIAFYFILKALFVLKMFKLLSWLFGHAEKTPCLER